MAEGQSYRVSDIGEGSGPKSEFTPRAGSATRGDTDDLVVIPQLTKSHENQR